MDKKPEFHGSDIEKISEYYNIPKETIINFGANVNPLGLSPLVKEQLAANLDIITTYPDRNYTSLKETIGNYCHISPEYIAVGNGSTELISLLITQRAPKKALIVGPTYSEYERELSLIEAELCYFNLEEKDNFQLNTASLYSTLESGIELIIICNPNNPTSSAISSEELEEILQHCQKHNIFIMIDETYAEFAPTAKQITAIPLTNTYDNVMVIRGVSKFFAAPGLRFGYGITSNKSFLRALLQHQNPWSLNSIAAYAGELMLKDTDYICRTFSLIDKERCRIYKELSTWHSIKVYPPSANFILIKLRNPSVTSVQIFEHLIRQGLMLRDCSSFTSLSGQFIRFCFMNPADNDRLLACLKTGVN